MKRFCDRTSKSLGALRPSELIWKYPPGNKRWLLAGAHLGGLFGCHDRPLFTVGTHTSIKYQTQSLQVSDAGVLEQATAYISLVTFHSTITKQQRYWVVKIAPAQWHETIHVFNTRNWYCVERTCFWISSSGSAGSDAVRISYTATHTQELFCNISLHGERKVSNHARFVLQFRAKFYL